MLDRRSTQVFRCAQDDKSIFDIGMALPTRRISRSREQFKNFFVAFGFGHLGGSAAIIAP